MKNFLRMILFATVLLVGSTAQAGNVRIYDYSVTDFINGFKAVGIAISGIEYGTNNGEGYCKMNFNNSTGNLVAFWLNNDGTISSAGITGSTGDTDSLLAVLAMSCVVIGMSDTEWKDFSRKLETDVNQRPRSNYYKNSFSVWCNAAQTIHQIWSGN